MFGNNFLAYFGIKKETESDFESLSYSSPQDKELTQKHLEYLQDIYHQNKNRQNLIENKNSQLVGQASIIISIFSLFVPLLVTKLIDLRLLIIIPLIIVFISIIFHYTLTIYHSTKTLEINRYAYSTPSVKTITNGNRVETKEEFIEEEINDLIYSISQNTYQTNRKGSNLIYATRNFRFACILFSFFTVFIIVSIFFIAPKKQEIIIKEIDTGIIKMLDSNLRNIFEKTNPSAEQLANKIENLNCEFESQDEKQPKQKIIHPRFWIKKQ